MQENRLVQTFLDLVKIDSPTGREEKVRGYVSHFIQKLGLKSFQDTRGNLIVKVDGIGETLLLGAHLDTVEPGRNIKPQVKDGIIRSSGKTILGADNKVAVAAMLEVLKSIAENKTKTKSLDIVFTLAEESGEFGSSKLDYSKVSAKKGYTFDSLSALGTIVTASPFYNRFDIKIIGKSTHASTPEEGVNTLKILGGVLNKIKLGKVNDKTIVNIGMVSCGNGINTVPGETTIKGEVRSFVEKDAESCSQDMIRRLKETALQFGGTIKAEIFRESSGYEYEVDDEFIKTTKKTIKDFGLKPFLVKKWACSDANIFNNRNMQILNLGDGVVNAHTVDEHIAIKDLSRLAELVLFLASCKD